MIRKNKKGFTLVELLVVIAVIAMLMGMLMTVYGHFVEKSHRASCLNNLKQLHGAIQLYATNNNGSYPLPGSNDAAGGLANDYIWGIVEKGEIYACPSDESIVMPPEKQSDVEAATISYAFAPGLRSDTDPFIAVIADDDGGGSSQVLGPYSAGDNHEDNGGNCVTVDGTGKFINGADEIVNGTVGGVKRMSPAKPLRN